MNNERYNQIIDEVYLNYCEEQKIIVRGEIYRLPIIFSKEELINKIKSDSEFSKNFGLKIEERELSSEDRYNWYINTHNKNLTRSSNQFDVDEILNSNNIPTKLITITYNNETIESYE